MRIKGQWNSPLCINCLDWQFTHIENKCLWDSGYFEPARCIHCNNKLRYDAKLDRLAHVHVVHYDDKYHILHASCGAELRRQSGARTPIELVVWCLSR